MRRSRLAILLPSLLAALALLAVFSGCTRQARYPVLTFFFTGVPPLDAPDEPPPAETPTVDPALAKRALILAKAAAEAAKPYEGPFIHGPYASRACDQCHEMAAGGFGFGTTSQGADKTIVPGKFVLPPDQLCVACHTSKSVAVVQAAGLRLHGPAWNCTLCHHSHNSQNRYFLRLVPAKLCRQCHADGFIHDTELHAGVEDCLDCHNPHMGRDAFMLRDDYQETF